jgi:hypothetical protein
VYRRHNAEANTGGSHIRNNHSTRNPIKNNCQDEQNIHSVNPKKEAVNFQLYPKLPRKFRLSFFCASIPGHAFNHGITITCHNKANIISHEDTHLKLIVRVSGLVLVEDGLLDDLGGLGNLVLDTRGSGSLLGHTVGLNTLGVGLLGDGDLVAAVVANELSKGLDGAGAAVLNGLVLGAGLEELDGGEARDVIGNVVGGGVNLGDGDLVGEGRVLLGELVVLGGEGLAVSAPGGVELEENVLVVVNNEVLVALGDDHGGTRLLLLGNRLALDAGLDLATNKLLNESADSLLADVLSGTLLGEGVLLVLGDVLDGERGPGANLEVEVAGVLAESGSVDGSEVDLSAVLLSDGLQVGGERLALLGGLGEDVGEGKAGLVDES